VQRLAIEALQEIRIKHRWEALDSENDAIEQAKINQIEYLPEVLSNGDTVKQLLARSRYALYKKPNTWTESQKERAELVFERFPDLKRAYELALELSNIFTTTTEKIYGLTRLAKWHEKVRQSGFKSFNTVARSIENHYKTIVTAAADRLF
jgi:transposase